MLYFTNEASFNLPPELHDKTFQIFTVTADGPSEFTVVISRNALSDGENLAVIAERLPRELKAKIPTCQIRYAKLGRLGAEPAFFLEYSFVEQGSLLLQRQFCLIYAGTDRDPLLLQVTGTGLVNAARPVWKPEWDAMYQRISSTLRLRDPSG